MPRLLPQFAASSTVSRSRSSWRQPVCARCLWTRSRIGSTRGSGCLPAARAPPAAPHGPLRASIDWSYELLNTDEQLLIDRLSVFVGGFELDSAETVCSTDEYDTVLLLATLVDKSLVEADEVEEQIRYRLLETIRQYAAERLDSRGAGEVRATRRAHRDHYLALAERAALELRRKDGVRWLDTLEMEHANLRAALNFCLTDGDVEEGLRLAVALRLFWSVRGYGAEALETLDKLLDAADAAAGPDSAGTEAALRARAMTTTAYLLGIHGSYEAGLLRSRGAVDLARSIDDPSGTADALIELGALLRFTGDSEGALLAYEEALRLAEGAPGGLVDIAAGGRATVLGTMGDLAESRAALSAAIGALEKSGDRFVTVGMLSDLGLLEVEAGEHLVARAHLDEALGS